MPNPKAILELRINEQLSYEEIGKSESGARQWVLLRKVAYHKIGRSVRIDPAEVERILAEGYVPARNANQGHGTSEERSGRRPRRNGAGQAEAKR